MTQEGLCSCNSGDVESFPAHTQSVFIMCYCTVVHCNPDVILTNFSLFPLFTSKRNAMVMKCTIVLVLYAHTHTEYKMYT